jgi:prevent-host-death family protein
MNETSVGVRELKTHLSEYLREIKKGKTIIITEHGKTVGRLIPAGSSVESRMEALSQSGLVRWSGKKIAPMKPIAPLRGSKNISDLIIEARE